MVAGREVCRQVKAWWASYLYQGTRSYILAKKLVALKLDIKKRNEAEFGNVTFKKQQTWSKLNALDAKGETHLFIADEQLEPMNNWNRLISVQKLRSSLY